MRRVATLFSFLALPGAAHAQTVSGSVTDSVLDPSHAAIASVQVTATELEKKFRVTTRTGGARRFAFTQLSPGTYAIGVEASGFKKYEQAGITLSANDRQAIGEPVMQAGTLAESIEMQTV